MNDCKSGSPSELHSIDHGNIAPEEIGMSRHQDNERFEELLVTTAEEGKTAIETNRHLNKSSRFHFSQQNRLIYVRHIN